MMDFRLRMLVSSLPIVKKILKSVLAASVEARDKLRWRKFYRPTAGAGFDEHLRAAVDWLLRAQDAGDDKGVSYGTQFGSSFDVSYPETTGYIIPTFIQLADYYKDPTFLERAIAMGDWEISVQLADGSVMAGKYFADNRTPAPALFNTGQVLLGWAALGKATGEQRFLDAGRRAGQWMIDHQEPDGNWIRGNSPYADSRNTLYNVKAAWGLYETGAACSWNEAIDSAVKNARYCLTRQNDHGWFANCCLDDAAFPLLHTQAYTMQGLVGIGAGTGQSDFIEGARRLADPLIDIMGDDGFLPGRFNEDFSQRALWACMTGSAQTGIVWSRLFDLLGDPRYAQASKRVNSYLSNHHDLTHENPAIRGGVPGSWPVSGGYQAYGINNWGVNFYVESMLFEAQRHAAQALNPGSVSAA